MGKDLRNEKGDYCGFNNTGWSSVLELAEAHGWQPHGTQPPRDWDDNNSKAGDPRPWDGRNYLSNDGQMVTREDASQIADALEESLQDIPNEVTYSSVIEALKSAWLKDRGIEVQPMICTMFGLGLFLYVPHDKVSPKVGFIGEGKDKLRDFIRFCRGGAFRIW